MQQEAHIEDIKKLINEALAREGRYIIEMQGEKLKCIYFLDEDEMVGTREEMIEELRKRGYKITKRPLN